MFVLESIGLSLIVAFGFGFGHLLINLLERTWVFKRWRFDPYVIDVLIGLTYGVISLALQLVLWAIATHYGQCVALITTLLLMTYRRWTMAITNSVFSILFCILTFDISLNTYFSISAVFITLLALYLVKLFWPGKLELKLLIIAGALLVISYLINSSLRQEWLNQVAMQNTLLLILSLSINLVVFRYVYKFIRSARQLQETSINAPNGYLRYAVALSDLTKRIQERQLNNGLWVLFDFHFAQNEQSSTNLEVTQAAFNKVRLALPANALLFNLSPKINGFFIPNGWTGSVAQSLENNQDRLRPPSDGLALVESALQSAQGTYVTSTAAKITVQFKAAAMIYNVQATSFEELESMTVQGLNNFELNGNIVQLFDAEKSRVSLLEQRAINELDRELRLDDLSINYWPIASINKALEMPLFLVNATSETAFSNHQDLRKFLKLTNWDVIFDRYVASEAVQQLTKKNASKTMLIIPYAALWKSPNYNFNLLAQKLRQRQIAPTQLILWAEQISTKKTLIDNVRSAQTIGFKIALSSELPTSLISELKPAWVINQQAEFTPPIDYNSTKQIWAQTKLTADAKKMQKLGVKYFVKTDGEQLVPFKE